MSVSTKELREQREKLLRDCEKINDEHAGKDSWAEKEQEYDRMFNEAQELGKRITREEALREARTELAAPIDHSSPPNPDDSRDRRNPGKGDFIQMRQGNQYVSAPTGERGTKDYRNAYNKFLCGGMLNSEELAALQSDNDTQAGYLVASEQLASGILKNVDDLLFVRRYARIHTVREAGSLGIRKRTTKASTWGWTSELGEPTPDTALAYGKRTLTPHYAAGELKVSRDLLRRASESIEMIVSEEMGIDAAELMEDAYLTGNGSQQPLGVFTASADGISTSRDVSEGNTGTAFTADGLRNAMYALKAQYRLPGGDRSGCRWLFHRDAIKMLAKLKDGEGQYLWSHSMREGEPDRLLGYPVDESERAPNTFTTGQYVGLLANWRYYEIADALDMDMNRLDELYARSNQVGFIARLKTDGMPTLEEAFVRVKLG